MSWLLTVIAIVAAGVAVWQACEARKQAEAARRQAEAAEQSNRLARQCLMEEYIEQTVGYWRQRGEPDTYLSTLPNLTDAERKQIRDAAQRRHKGR